MDGESRFEFSLLGPGGEPIDLWRTMLGHGLAALPPLRLDEAARTLTVTLAVPAVGVRSIRIGACRSGHGTVAVLGPPLRTGAEPIRAAVRHLLRLDEDLSAFYGLAAADPALAWVTAGAGRMIRSPTVFEDVVKTICTTNCTWSATERMVGALVSQLGEPAIGVAATRGESDPASDRAFPTPAAMAAAPEEFYRDVARAGYRGRYLRALAESVATAAIDLEELAEADMTDLPDAEVERRLLALPGVGPYAAAHVMMMLGRYARLILDSWTRPTYRRLTGETPVTDQEIEARFAGYGRYAGLAFWLLLTRDWVSDGEPGSAG